MKFTEFTIHTTSEGSEIIADVLWGYTNYGVAISDVKDVIALQQSKAMYWDYIDESLTKDKREALVKAFVPLEETEVTAPKIRADIETAAENGRGFIDFGTLEITKRIVEGDDWLEIWRKHFRPLHIGASVVIVPEWIDYAKEDGEVIIKLDSNMAFGTGEHETTSMCLKLLQEYLKEGDVCIDVGCGSGILGIAAIKLGASLAYLTDIDDIAVKSAKHNCLNNGVSAKAIVAHSDLLEGGEIKGDVMLANITAEILCRLAPSIPKNLKKGGTLILSGIIESRLDMVITAFTAQNLTLEKQIKEGEWFALAFKS
ncbi:MAG: 50S ribosomal protein L11 methyltransferase [Clostridia bacterium]|nr:50S ribosomal protein L11 methyltransferase [Clostridia bacterium]MDE7214577.1 50S ribosomal protein L11 methyltransferase [Clostridia bacterium]